MVLIQDRILKIDIYNFEMSYKTPEKSLKSNQIYSVYFWNINTARWLEANDECTSKSELESTTYYASSDPQPTSRCGPHGEGEEESGTQVEN